ncbi:MAG: sulfotransferase domain-containing protein [Ferruginibacter sp.]
MDKKINCFLIGAQKAGTSSFYDWISQHPEIEGPDQMKDMHFFTLNRYFQKGYSWLESFYGNKKGAKVRLQGAVNYIFLEEAPGKILEYNAESKFILILRNPVRRAFSAFKYFEKLGVEKRPFADSLSDEFNKPTKEDHFRYNFTYINHGYYCKQLQTWLKYFRKEQFCILIYEEVFKNPESYIKQVFEFLGVNADFKPRLTRKNETGEVKYRWLNNLIFANPKLLKALKKAKLDRIISFSIRVKFLNWLRDWNTDKNKKKDTFLSMEEYKELMKNYEGDIIGLSQLLNKNFLDVWK